MTMEVSKKKNEFSIFDKLDEEQIKQADKEIKQALVYEANGKKQITFIGLKYLTLTMSQNDQPLEIIKSEVHLDKDDPDDKQYWYWRASVIVVNKKTGLQTEGISECSYLEKTDYDPFGRTKAHSKAERNAWRKQIPEIEIQALLKVAKGEEVHTVSEGKFCTCLPTVRNIDDKKENCNTCKKPLTETVSQFYKDKK